MATEDADARGPRTATAQACSSSSSDDKEPVAETSQEITKSQLKIVGSIDWIVEHLLPGGKP